MFAEKTSAVAAYGGGGTAVLSGAAMEVQKFLGMSPAEWQVLGVIGGLGIGFVGLVVNIVFQWLKYRRGD